MALTFGQLASGAGAVGTGMRQAEEAERVARQNQLRIEEQNRANQAAKEIQASRAGLQVPTMPNFTGGTGGQQFGIPQAAPAAPPAPAAPAVVPEVTVGPMTAEPPTTAAPPTPVAPQNYNADGELLGDNELSIMGIPTGMYAYTASPFGRSVDRGIGNINEYADQQKTEAQERNELADLRRQAIKQYGLASGPGGLLIAQTDEERAFAKEVQSRVRQLTRPELEQLLQTGQLPPKAAPTTEPRAGVKEPAAEEPLTTAQGSQPRSVRNNNPGNLIFNKYTQSLGATGKDKDGFAIFPDSQVGQQASIANLQNYGTKGINTVSAITNRWSPPNAPGNTKKSTDNYTAYVAAKLGVDPNQPLDMNDTQMLGVMAEAISEFESGHTSPLVGKNPGQTADRVATAAAAPATSGLMFGPSAVAGGAQNPGVQSALLLRQTLANEYEIYNRNRMFGQADEALAQIAGIDLGLYKAQADLGVYELSTSGDASRAMSVLSQFTGVPTQALDRGDGTYDLYTNGRVSQTAVPVDKLADLVKTQTDAGYRQQKAELASAIAKERAQSSREFGKEEIKGQYSLAVERLKQANPRMEIDNLGDGRAIITEPGSRPYAVDLNSPIIEKTAQGDVVTGYRRIPIN